VSQVLLAPVLWASDNQGVIRDRGVADDTAFGGEVVAVRAGGIMTTFSAYLDALSADSEFKERARRHWLVASKSQLFLLYLSDSVVLLAAFLVAMNAREFLPFASPASPLSAWIPFALVGSWLFCMHLFGADSLRHLRSGATEYKRVMMASFTMAGVVGITSYLLNADFPRGLYVPLFAVGTSGLVLTRLARRKAMGAIHRRGLLTSPILVAGDSGHVDSIAKVLHREHWLGYRVIGAITRDRAHTTPGGLPVLGSLADAVDIIRGQHVESVIFAEGSFDSPADFRRMAWQLEEQEIQMIVVPTATDISAQRLAVRPVAGLPLVDVDRPQAIAAARWIKRTFDVIGSAFILLLIAPIMGLVALAIKLEDGGPILFRQPRIGRKGQTFECLKFRSMVLDAEARLAELASKNEGSGPLFKMTHDPRITKVGRFIRRFSLDELPQLWNALRGDMSLVGPRPALPTEVAQYDSDTRRRLDVRPGLTGLWQVSGRSNLSWDDTVRLDLYYVDNWSMIQDLMILARTAKAVVGSAGAY
jgi:exopolysaccharide biosynthesis polyprenyl glycosylphosphotransferase